MTDAAGEPQNRVRLEKLAETWTRDVWFFLRVKGFDIDMEQARRTALDIAKSIVREEAHRAELGRQRRRQLEVQGNICASISLGYSNSQAAERAGVSREALRLWRRDDADFRRAVQEAERRGRASRRAAEVASLRRPKKMTESVRAAITDLLTQGVTRRQALATAGVSRQTFHTWMNREQTFRRAVLAAEGRPTSS